MHGMELTATEGIDAQPVQELATRLRRHLEVDGPHTYFRRADPSTLPQSVQLIGDAALWPPLPGPAGALLTAYLGRLGKRAADATADKLFAQEDVKPLGDVARALADARAAAGGRIEIVVGLDIPDRHSGTALHIAADSAEDIAHPLAAFVVQANELSRMMKAEVEAGRAPFGRAVVTLEQDGLAVRWRSIDGARHKRYLPTRRPGAAGREVASDRRSGP